MNKKIYVIAGNAMQAKQWIRANRIAPKDACIVVWIEQLYGIRGSVAVLHGTYWENMAYQH